MQMVAARRVAALQAGGIRRAQPLSGSRWVLYRRTAAQPPADELIVVDAALAPVWRLTVPVTPGWRGAHAVADDHSAAALSLPREVRLVDRDGRLLGRLPYPAVAEPSNAEAGCCAFTADGHWLWAIAPSPQSGDELWLIELATLQVRDRAALGYYAGACLLTRHPDGDAVGARLIFGQDGELLRWASPSADRISLHALEGAERILAAIHPSGGQYLTVPLSGAGELTQHRYPDGSPTATLAATTLPSGHRWGLAAGYLTDEQVVVGTAAERAHVAPAHLLVGVEPMVVLGQIVYSVDGSVPPGRIVACHAGRWLTTSRDGVQCWTLA